MKLFYLHNLRMFIISQRVCPWQAFPAQHNVLTLVGKARSLPQSGAPRVSSGLTLEYQTRLERLARYKHSSLLRTLVNYGHKNFNNILPRVGIQKAFLRTSYDHSFCLSFLCSDIRTHGIRIISWLFHHCAIEAQTLRSLGFSYLNIHCNSTGCYGAHYKTFYGRNCCCIVISQSVCH